MDLDAAKKKTVDELNTRFKARFNRMPQKGEEWLIEELATIRVGVDGLVTLLRHAAEAKKERQ